MNATDVGSYNGPAEVQVAAVRLKHADLNENPAKVCDGNSVTS